ncbi:MAG: CapA family protein [Pseudomonadota bacterium]
MDPPTSNADSNLITLFLCGDVMTGRGIDQILPHPSNPRLYEPVVRSALEYVQLAEEANGPIPRPVDFPYIWGDALAEFERTPPDARIINLETAVTTSEDFWPKGINYRMHPKNIPCLSAARIDCCVLANNHVLDWGYAGLTETLSSLAAAGIHTAGAGKDIAAAQAPAIIDLKNKGRIIVAAYGSETSGIHWNWRATRSRAGVNLLPDLSPRTVEKIAQDLNPMKQRRDLVVFSIHWGGNWGYDIPEAQREFAHRLIDEAGVDIVYGHSSHHIKGIEIHQGKPILYGCGDFLNDYEGIGGYEGYRGDLALMYFITMNNDTGRLANLEMTPMQTRKFRAHYAARQDARWIANMLSREGNDLNTRAEEGADSRLQLRWM